MSVMRRSLQVVAFLCTLIVGVTSMVLIVTQTAWFSDWLRGFIVRQAEDYVNGDLSIGRLDGNLFFGVRLADVDIVQNGKTVVGIDGVGLDYNVFSFFTGDVTLDDIRITRPVLRLERTADGKLNLAHLLNLPTPDPNKPKSNRRVEIGEVGISDGTLYVEPGAVATGGVAMPAKLERLDASVGVKSNADELVVDIAHVSLRASDPAFGINALSGVVRRTEHEVRLDSLSLRTEESSLRVTGTVGHIETRTAGGRFAAVVRQARPQRTRESGAGVARLRHAAGAGGHGVRPRRSPRGRRQCARSVGWQVDRRARRQRARAGPSRGRHGLDGALQPGAAGAAEERGGTGARRRWPAREPAGERHYGSGTFRPGAAGRAAAVERDLRRQRRTGEVCRIRSSAAGGAWPH